MLVGSRYNSKIRSKRSFTIIGMYLTELTVGQKGERAGKREKPKRGCQRFFFEKDREKSYVEYVGT